MVLYNKSIIETFYREPQAKPKELIKVYDTVDLSSVITREWVLVLFHGGQARWLSRLNLELIRFPFTELKTMRVEDSVQEIDTTVKLMKAAPGSAVIWALPDDFKKSFKEVTKNSTRT